MGKSKKRSRKFLSEKETAETADLVEPLSPLDQLTAALTSIPETPSTLDAYEEITQCENKLRHQLVKQSKSRDYFRSINIVITPLERNLIRLKPRLNTLGSLLIDSMCNSEEFYETTYQKSFEGTSRMNGLSRTEIESGHYGNIIDVYFNLLQNYTFIRFDATSAEDSQSKLMIVLQLLFSELQHIHVDIGSMCQILRLTDIADISCYQVSCLGNKNISGTIFDSLCIMLYQHYMYLSDNSQLHSLAELSRLLNELTVAHHSLRRIPVVYA